MESGRTMEQTHREIAPRLRGLRDALDLGVEAFAVKIGVGADTVREFESGEVEIPVGYLMKVAQTFDVDLTALITGCGSHLRHYSVVRKGEGVSVDRRKDYDYKSLAATFVGRRMEPFLIRVPAKAPEELNFTAHCGQEFIHILEGRLEMRIGDNVVVLEPGDSLYFDSQTPHSLRGLDGKEAVFLDVIL